MFIKILFAIIAVFIVFFYIISLKYRQNYTMCFVFGKKGSGKTCYLVHEILKYKRKGWTIYTDFNVNIDGVRKIDAKMLGEFIPEENSLILLDEVGITFNNRNYKQFTDEQVRFWKLQRHYKVKCIMCSQGWDVDVKLRTLTDSMILQTNIGNVISVSRPILRGLTLTEPTAEGEARIADTLRFSSILHWKFYYMPKYFKYFDSYEIDENQKYIPYILQSACDLAKKKPNLHRLFPFKARAEGATRSKFNIKSDG